MASVQFNVSPGTSGVTPGTPSLTRATNVPDCESFSVSFWLRIDTYEDWAHIFALEHTVTTTRNFYLEGNAGGSLYLFEDNGGTSVNLWTDSYTGWAFICITGNATGIRAYFQRPGGNWSKTTDIASTAGAHDYMAVGSEFKFAGDANSQFDMAELRIWNVTLTESEAQKEKYYSTPQKTSGLTFANDMQSASDCNVDESGTGGNFTKNGTPTDDAGSHPIWWTSRTENFDAELVPRAWFDPETYPTAWFDDEYVVSGPAAYTLSADSGSYTETGQTAALKAARKLVADSGTYTETGQAATLGLTLPVASGSYTFTGQTAGLRATRFVTAVSGSYSETGQAVTLGLTLPVASGSYSFTGQSAGLPVARRLSAASGSYSFTGQAANLTRGRTLTPDSGSYTETGQDAGLRVARKLSATAGAYTHTGQAVNLNIGHTLAANAGSYALSGQTAGLRVGRKVDASAGSYSASGQAVTPRVTLPVSSGSYVHTGQTAGLRAARKIGANSGPYTHTGQSAALGRGFTLAAAAGAILFAGQAASLETGRRVAAQAGAFSVAAPDATLTLDTGDPDYHPIPPVELVVLSYPVVALEPELINYPVHMTVFHTPTVNIEVTV